MLRPGTKAGQDKYKNMNGWGLAVLGWCGGGDCELGPDQMYLALHRKSIKWSIFTSRIFAAPGNVTYAIQNNITFNDTDDDNDTADANDTDSANDTAPASAPAAATPAPAAPPAGGAAPAAA